MFFQIPALTVTLSAIAVLIFSACLLYDLSNIVRGGETNYIMATMNLFLNLFNIFISLLNLLLAFHRAARLNGNRQYLDGRLAGAHFFGRPVLSCRSIAYLSNSAIDSTCAVCGNMLTTPAAARRYPRSCTSTAASRASVAGLHET